MSVLSGSRQVFDSTNSQWSPHKEYNLMFLRAQQQYCNDKLHASNSPLFLNEVLDMLGFSRTKDGQLVGWAPESTVDFGVTVDDKNPEEIILNFNVDGEVYNLLP